MEYCGWLEVIGVQPCALRRFRSGNDLVHRPLAQADRAHLAGLHGAVQSLQRLVERRFLVVAMALIEIDVVDAQPLQRTVKLLGDLRRGEPLIRLSPAPD